MVKILSHTPEDTARGVIDRCADCDVCRHLMDINCLLFPELFRLFDREKETGRVIERDEIKKMIDLCNFCALCPCPNIRSEIMRAKAEFVDQDGLKKGVRLLEDVALVGKICGTFPGMANALLGSAFTGKTIKRALGIHPERKLPKFPRQSFQAWAENRGLDKRPRTREPRKVAYFVGCTASYLYPQVAKAAVAFLEASGISVWFPPQQCCGMPAYLEGDKKRALKFAQAGLEQLCDALDDGFDIVTSCPTCGFMFRNLLKSGAYYAKEYQTAIGAAPDLILTPKSENSVDGKPGFFKHKKAIYGKILVDDGVFADISALKRVKVAEHIFDIGEYVVRIGNNAKHPVNTDHIGSKMVYFPPCHQRELNMGKPYLKLLRDLYGENVSSIDGDLYCCGMAGIMGFKQDFHASSRNLGKNLLAAIGQTAPDLIVTDCLSCRLQFEQFTPYAVKHPVELL
ncbi:MAG: FeS-binding protein [Deltaproteobacteria bacterium]|nr:FeS-binding protein [Deltaproteobacteria bacterium]MBW2677093.1 FeS-binding protein [Deltaproteobacteria bacterium]